MAHQTIPQEVAEFAAESGAVEITQIGEDGVRVDYGERKTDVITLENVPQDGYQVNLSFLPTPTLDFFPK